MNKNVFKSGIAFLGLAFASLSPLMVKENVKEEVKAYYTPDTTYEVSDTPEEFASYYSGVTDSLSGSDLLSKLQSINSSKRKKTMGYGTMGTSINTSCYIYTDYDLNSTQVDKNGQVYGTKVASFYTKTAATGWNREHMWPQSHGGKKVEADVLHTRPTIAAENSSRGNSFYVEGKNSNSAGWDPYTAGYDKECRGECARVILYSVVANSQLGLTDTDSHSTSNANPDNLMGNMNTLIKWHFDYSPNVYEMNRNNGAEYLQGNRNPFVDHPEYVARIWSNFNTTVKALCDENASMYENWVPGRYSSYGTNDAVVGEDEPSVKLDKSSISLFEGETEQINASIKNGTGTISWTSNNTSVATVSSSGLVTAVSQGNAIITASVTIKGVTYSSTCTVQVAKSTPLKILDSISLSNITSTYNVGDTFVKPTVTAHYSNLDTEDVTDEAIFTGYDMNSVGLQPVTVSYTETNLTKTAEYEITVVQPEQLELVRIYIDSLPDKTSYRVGERLDLTGLKVIAVYSDESEVDITDDIAIDIVEVEENGFITVTVTYEGKTATFEVVGYTPNAPIPSEKKGCSGDVLTTSVILSALAVSGIVAIILVSILRKKKEIK